MEEKNCDQRPEIVPTLSVQFYYLYYVQQFLFVIGSQYLQASEAKMQ